MQIWGNCSRSDKIWLSAWISAYLICRFLYRSVTRYRPPLCTYPRSGCNLPHYLGTPATPRRTSCSRDFILTLELWEPFSAQLLWPESRDFHYSGHLVLVFLHENRLWCPLDRDPAMLSFEDHFSSVVSRMQRNWQVMCHPALEAFLVEYIALLSCCHWCFFTSVPVAIKTCSPRA